MNDDLPKRKTVRLSGYNYAEEGLYFMTICTQERENLFGEVVEELMVLNDVGKMIETTWVEIPTIFPNIFINTIQIMPDHIHVIIEVGADLRVRPQQIDTINESNRLNNHNGSTQRSTPTLGTYIQRFKTITTHRYIDGINNFGWKHFNRRLWQRNYFEHIIRDEDYLDRIRYYIKQNPENWEKDK